jgi:MoxR-like ATPase
MPKVLDQWAMVATAIRHARVVLLCGAPGVGKTFAALNAPGAANGIVALNLSEDTVVQELFGHYVPQGGQFVYRDGPVIVALREGRTLVINELSRASGAVKDALLGALDSMQSAKITLPSGETVTAHDSFRAIITSNESSAELDAALRDRCETVVNLTEPHPELIAALNRAMPQLGDAVRDSYADPDRAISSRAAFAFARLQASGVDVDVAAYLTFAERASDILNTLKLRGAAVR